MTPCVGGLFISSNMFIFDHNYYVKGGLKVIECIVQSAEYWCPYGTCKSFVLLHYNNNCNFLFLQK